MRTRVSTMSKRCCPGANCGGCGYAGCRTFASTAVGVDDMSGLFCPVGGAETMKRIADFLGKAAPEREPMVAVLALQRFASQPASEQCL